MGCGVDIIHIIDRAEKVQEETKSSSRSNATIVRA